MSNRRLPAPPIRDMHDPTIKLHQHMSRPDQSFNVTGCVSDTFIQVFETMLSMKAEPAPDRILPHHQDRITGSVGFGGEKVTGAAYIHLCGATATRAASAMLGMTVEELGESEINDVVGELCNMITGGLKSGLCDAGLSCAMSTPAIIRGSSFQIESMPGVRREVMLFDCQDNRIVVEVHIKFC
jgi:CheY-specific phosphatase CheX